MPNGGCEVVVVGASAGGVEALCGLVSALPADFPVPVLVVLHVPSSGPSLLPEILRRVGRLPASHARDGEELRPGHIYIAPPDHHLLVANGRLQVNHGPRENGHRPAVDTLFRSAAAAYDSHVAAVVLSGMLTDGTVGLHLVKEAGGATLVQDPEEALYASMPANAIAYTRPDYVMTIDRLTAVLTQLTADAGGAEPLPVGAPDPAPDPADEQAQPGDIVPFTCPDCGGTLWESRVGDVWTFRCRVGHSYTTNNLAAFHGETVERALWTAYRSLEERAAMSRRVARRMRDRGRLESAVRFERQADTSTHQADELRAILERFQAFPETHAAQE